MNVLLTTLATVLLAILGVPQLAILIAQQRQAKIVLVSAYRTQWYAINEHWGIAILIGRNSEDYYQILTRTSLRKISLKLDEHNFSEPTVWALESIQKVCGLLGEVCIRILQGHLSVSDAYPIFGTEFLRHNRPLRILLDSDYPIRGISTEAHLSVRTEVQDWLIYHDGLRRRCLILIDLLWAEAARIEDLPPGDMRIAAESKEKSGIHNRKRIFREALKLRGIWGIYAAYRFALFLKQAEYFSYFNFRGIRKRRIVELNNNWVRRLLRK